MASKNKILNITSIGNMIYSNIYNVISNRKNKSIFIQKVVQKDVQNSLNPWIIEAYVRKFRMIF